MANFILETIETEIMKLQACLEELKNQVRQLKAINESTAKAVPSKPKNKTKSRKTNNKKVSNPKVR